MNNWRLPPGPLLVIDWFWFHERLSDKRPLFNAVIFANDGAGMLLVPVGEKRRAGYASFGDIRDALRCFRILKNREDFPNLRLRISTDIEACHGVEWGEAEPELDYDNATEREWIEHDKACGRLYGYSEDAIASHLKANEEWNP